MHIRTKAFLMGTALALVLGLFPGNALALVTLADDADTPVLSDEETPKTLDLGLDSETPSEEGLIIPPQKDANKPQPINLAEGPQPIVPKTGNGPQPIVPKTGNGPQPIVPKTGVAPKPVEPKAVQAVNPVGVLGAAKFGNVDSGIFEKMSELEKQTAVLSLELRKEQVQNEIEAVKNQRTKAAEEARAAEEEKARKKAEWEREQAIKVIQEQQKLKELEIAQEKLHQEKLLKDYKNKMLLEKQDWISKNANLYQDIDNLRKEKNDLAEKVRGQYARLSEAADKAKEDAIRIKEELAKENADLQSQISILKARLEAQERELEMERQNPFAEGASADVAGGAAAVAPINVVSESLSDLFAVMEIRGQGDELYAKLMNKDGVPFMVKKGSVLQNGQIVDEVTSTYIRTDTNGVKDYLYFAGGGFWNKSNNAEEKPETNDSAPAFVVEKGIPSIGKDMFAR